MTRVTVTDDGGWCWFQDPRAVRHRGTHDRTYVGWITRHGDVRVGRYDHAAEAVAAATLHADFEPDDHDDPTIAVRPDGRLLVFYTRHGGSAVHYRCSTAPESVAAFGPERHIEPGPDPSVTYPNPRWVDGDLHLFLRNDGTVVDVVSPDGGETWREQRELVSTGGEGWCVYAKPSRARDGEVHLGLTHAMGGRDEPHRHVSHARFDGDALRASDGTVLGRVSDRSLPVAVDETTRVFDSEATGDDAWVWDSSTAGGVPQLAYVRLVAPDDHRYRYARWDGTDWADEFLCHGGSHIVDGDSDERYYSGGVVLDHDSPGVCYASVGNHDCSALAPLRRVDGAWRTTEVANGDV
ncbi:MAG: BNR-4 repeat-containing protein [Haloarculaceae archaeon]